MSDEEAGGVWFWLRFWLLWFLLFFGFVVGVMVDTWWDIGVIIGFGRMVVLMYLGEWFVEFFVVP